MRARTSNRSYCRRSTRTSELCPHQRLNDGPDFHIICDGDDGARAWLQNPVVALARKHREHHIAADHRHANFAWFRISGGVGDEDVAIANATCRESLAFDA